jgi:Ser/Thr protein kinase RdoA (MazF antagonist)
MASIHRRTLRLWQLRSQQSPDHQVIHGDAHRRNVLLTGGRATFIDFDKMMVGPRTFDLAKYISTSCFYGTRNLRLAREAVEALLAAYESVSPLRPVERDSLNALAILLTADSDVWARGAALTTFQLSTKRAARWWTTAGRTLGLRQPRPVGTVGGSAHAQLRLFDHL